MEQQQQEDRISNLPDEILHHILSKIHIKEAVQTCILSKRWKSLWRSLPDLDFDFRHFAIQSHQNPDRMPCFTDFATKFLSHRDNTTGIRRFQLSSSYMTPMDSRFAEKYISYAIDHGAQHLDLDAYFHPTSLNFPDGLFASKTLRVLKLKQYTRSVVIPKPFILSNLEILHLERFEFRDDDDLYSFAKEPFSSFPNLEKLSLHRCGVSGLIISASKLKILEILFQDQLFLPQKKIEKISTPRLTSFRYEGYASLLCSNVDFPCLEEVYVDILTIFESPYTVYIKKNMPLNTVKLLQHLGNAKFVTLTLATIEVLEMDLNLLEQSPSPFPNIKCLKLMKGPYTSFPMKIIPSILMNYLTRDLHME